MVLTKLKLRGQLILASLVPALMVGLCATVVGAWSLERSADVQLEAALAASANRAAVFLDRTEARMRAVAELAAAGPGLGRALAAHDNTAAVPILDAGFAAVRRADKTLGVLGVADRAGRVVHRAHNPGQSGDDKSRVPDVASALEGRATVGVVVSPTTGDVAIGAVVPVMLDGAVVGTVVGTIRAGGKLDQSSAEGLGQAAGAEVLLFSQGKLKASTMAGLEQGGL